MASDGEHHLTALPPVDGPVPRGPLDPALRLAEAAAHPDPDRLWAEVEALRRAGLGPLQVLDVLVPAAARRMGADWAEDRLPFAAVAAGCAGLQGLVRRLEPLRPVPERGGLAIVLPVPGETHVLGAILAASQLRRAGVSTRLALGPFAETRALLRRGDPALLAISASPATRLESLRRLVETTRREGGGHVTIAVGGSLVTGSPEGPPTEDRLAEIVSRTRADLCATDILDVAARCGLIGPRTPLRAMGLAS